MLRIFHDPHLLGWEIGFYGLVFLGFIGFALLGAEAMYCFVLRQAIRDYQQRGKALPQKVEGLLPAWLTTILSICALLTLMLGIIYVVLQHEIIARNLAHPEKVRYEQVPGPFYRRLPD